MHKKWIITAGVFGALAVAFGAFGAHGLEKITNDPAILRSFNTGASYQLTHSLALLGVAVAATQLSPRWAKWSAGFFIAGIILFSGSLYVLTYIRVHGDGNVKFIGPVTPLGGLCFIAGWLSLAVAAYRKN